MFLHFVCINVFECCSVFHAYCLSIRVERNKCINLGFGNIVILKCYSLKLLKSIVFLMHFVRRNAYRRRNGLFSSLEF